MAASSTALARAVLSGSPICSRAASTSQKAASSPWETLKSLFWPRSFGALVRQTASRYTSVLLFLTLTAVLGLLARGMHRWGLAGSGGGRRLRRPALGGVCWKKPGSFVNRWRAGAAFCLGFLPVYAGVLTMGRGRSSRQCGQRSAADGTLLSGSAGSSLHSAAAPLLSDAQHGLLRQL